MEKELAQVFAENIDIKRRLDNLETADKRHEEDIRELYKAQEGTKVYVTQILNTIQQLETKLFSLVTNLSQNSQNNAKESIKERTKTQELWHSTFKYVIAGTIGAIVLYLFGQKG